MSAEPEYRDEKVLRRLYHKEGMSQNDIAEHFGCSRKTIGNWMNRHGIELNPGEKIRQKIGTGKDHHTYRRETRECENCGSNVTRRPSQFTGNVSFCDKDCQAEFTKNNSDWGPGKIITDTELLAELKRLDGDLDRPPSFDLIREHGEYDPVTYKNRFGSLPRAREAAGLDKHILFGKRGLRKYPESKHRYGPVWRERRRTRLEIDDYSCVVCGIGDDEHREDYGVGISVHHVVPARKFDNLEQADAPDNLITMCSSCHRRWEGVPVVPDTS